MALPFGLPSRCPVCDRPVPDESQPCSARCERRVDEWRDEPGEAERASEWLTVVDEEAA